MRSRILIVDDELQTASLIRERLVQRGFEVDCAGDGQEGLKKFHSQKYDAIILDIVMPKVSGTKILAEIRSVSRFVPVIMLTAYPDKDNAVESARQQVFDYIEKPICDWEGFLATVERAARTKDPVILAIEDWLSRLLPEERRQPLVFEGQTSYSPQQLLSEVEKQTELGYRQRLNIGRLVSDIYLESLR